MTLLCIIEEDEVTILFEGGFIGWRFSPLKVAKRVRMRSSSWSYRDGNLNIDGSHIWEREFTHT